MGDSSFNLSTVFATLAKTLPDHRVLICGAANGPMRRWMPASTASRVT